MSWLFSQALVEEFLGARSSDGEQSAPSNGNPTPLAYCAPDKMKDFSRLSRSGTMYKPLTEDLGEELLKSYREAFLVKTSPLQEKEMGLMENDPQCGTTWRGWLAKYDPNTSLWRTAQCSLLEEEPESLEILPRWGITRHGLLWEQPTLERLTKGTESGLSESIPTPNAWDAKRGPLSKELYESKTRQISLVTYVKHHPTKEKFPTPTATDFRDQPTSKNWKEKGGINYKLSNPEIRATWPTPTRRDYKSGTGVQDRPGHSPPLSNLVGGTLNPTWVEWLMGWPLGWTELKPLEMDKSLSAPPPPSES